MKSLLSALLLAVSLTTVGQEQPTPPPAPPQDKPANSVNETARPGALAPAADLNGSRGDVILDSDGGCSTGACSGISSGVVLRPKANNPWITGLSGSSSGGFAVINSAKDKQLFKVQDSGDTDIRGGSNPLTIWVPSAGGGNQLTIKDSASQGLAPGGFHVSMMGPGLLLAGGLQLGIGGTSMINGIVTGQPLNLNLWADRDVVIGGTSLHNSGLKVDSDGTSYYRGRVGIGTTTPGANYKLDVNGNANFSGTVTGGNIQAKYQDVAEWVPATGPLPAGTVVVLDSGNSNHVVASMRAYDTTVAGVVSARPGLVLGEAGDAKALVATTGRVRVHVDATQHAIVIGDLLVSSEKRGIAMKSMPVDVAGISIHRPGTVIGKALEPLASGEGEILVLLSLQ
jgi:hypothetical protein